jgi:hypothetical protein
MNNTVSVTSPLIYSYEVQELKTFGAIFNACYVKAILPNGLVPLKASDSHFICAVLKSPLGPCNTPQDIH